MKSSMLVAILLVSAGLRAKADESQEWAAIGKEARESIVQVLWYGAGFPWMEPYKAPRPSSGSGTAFFIDGTALFGDSQRIYLLTNYHVIEEAKAIYITMGYFGKKHFSVEVQGVCPEWDIALLYLSEESKEYIERARGPIKPLIFGDSDALYPTQPVLGAGYPLGCLTLKTASGAVAGRDFLYYLYHFQPMIHITVPSNPGNSGGPIFTKDGKVIGMNSRSMTNAQNYNYAIPSNDILALLLDLYTKKLVRHHHMGMIFNRATESHARSLGNPIPSGAYVSYVFEGSAEYCAGVRAGDMLYEVSINGQPFAVNEDGDVSVPWRKGEKIALAELIARCRTTDALSFIVYRKGERIECKSSCEDPLLYPIRAIYPDYEPKEADFEIFGGLVCMQLRINHIECLRNRSVESLFPIRKYLAEKKWEKHVLIVTQVFPGSQADSSRCIFTGSVLTAVNGDPVSTLNELRAALAKSAHTNSITLTTKDDFVTVFDLQKVIEEERSLSSDFKYALTKGMKNLMDNQHTQQYTA